MKFKIYKNTDTTDIDNKSLGLSVKPLDVPSTHSLNDNRGLHVQIRHNSNALTFDAANEVAALIAAAPEMLDALELCYLKLKAMDAPNDTVSHKALAAIKKARGEL